MALDGLGKHYRIYAEVLEPQALEQFSSAMALDHVVSGALMPDAHTGYSLPIGGVIASDGVVVPSWVGYDIGCGMCALPTSFDPQQVASAKQQVFEEIYRRIPVGHKVNAEPTDCDLDPNDLTPLAREAFWARGAFNALGSLGGGNHFIEVGVDQQNRVWVVIHSGSRGVGHGIAREYMKLASGGEKAKEGHHGLRVDSEAGQAYINDMNWALEFALANRREMMRRIISALGAYCDGAADWSGLINRNHNHAEERDGLWIHRKGATQAEAGMSGVIPGNMRDGSFIVEGKGNPESLYSSSHGAGRVLSRKKAKEQVSLEDFRSTMEGIAARVNESTLDESPFAYKNIFEVMRLQSELVEVKAHVRPMINIKG